MENTDRDKLSNTLETQYRAEMMETVLKNRIGHIQSWLDNGVIPGREIPLLNAKIDAYEDALSIVQKEFFDLKYPDNFIEQEIKRYKDELIEEVNPIEKYRGTSEYMKQMKLNGRIADMFEEIMFKMYNLGYQTKIKEETV